VSKLEDALSRQLVAVKAPPFEHEFRFSANHVGLGKGIKSRLKDAGLKDWRFDFAWPEIKLAVEVEGGIFVNGRHSRGAGFEGDCIKYGEAMKLGWNVYRCTGGMIKSGNALDTIEMMIDLLTNGES